MPQIKKITDLTAPELDLFSRYSESQLFHINEPNPGIFIAESPNVIERALNAGYEPLAVLIEEKQADDLIPKLFFAYPELPVYTAKFDLLTNLTGFALTRGLLCAMKRKSLPSVAEICEAAKPYIGFQPDLLNVRVAIDAYEELGLPLPPWFYAAAQKYAAQIPPDYQPAALLQGGLLNGK